VVEGSVQRAADRTHVTVELNKHHWNEWRAADAKDHQDDFVNAMVNGNSGEIDRALQKVIDHAEAGARRPYDVAGFATLTGNRTLALDGLGKSYQHHDYWLLFININVDPENTLESPAPDHCSPSRHRLTRASPAPSGTGEQTRKKANAGARTFCAHRRQRDDSVLPTDINGPRPTARNRIAVVRAVLPNHAAAFLNVNELELNILAGGHRNIQKPARIIGI
jgi:hypothetical protein